MSDQPSVCEEKTFNDLHASHALSLRNFLYYKTGSLAHAQDLAQEAFTRMWLNCAKVIFDKAKSFLFTTANRLFLDEIDHQKVVLKFEKRADRTEAAMEHNPEFKYRQEEFKETLEQVISDLPQRQREIFLMSRIDKMSYHEIATTLELSVKTVEKHLSGALRNLRSSLDEMKHLKI